MCKGERGAVAAWTSGRSAPAPSMVVTGAASDSPLVARGRGALSLSGIQLGTTDYELPWDTRRGEDDSVSATRRCTRFRDGGLLCALRPTPMRPLSPDLVLVAKGR